MKKLVIIIYPFNFRQFDWDRFEIDEIKKNSDLIIFDFINYLYPHFSKAYFKDKKIEKKLYKISKIGRFEDQLQKLINEYKTNILILNFMKIDSYKSFRINFILKKKKLRTLSFFNPGISVFNKNILKTNSSLKRKIFLLMKRRNETFHKIKGKFFNFFLNLFNLHPNFILVAGKSCKKNIYSYCKKNNIKMIDGHSWDYSLILRKRKKKISFKNYAVYLDAPGPKFLSDSHIFKEKFPETAKHTYPSLNRFFSFFEDYKKLNVIVAPHPKTKIRDRSPLFYKRRVIAGKTEELIKNCEFIITRNSTAVTFAAYYKKPIILFFTNESKNTESERISNELAESLNVRVINIDELKSINIEKIFKFKKKSYQEYLNNFCTTKKNFLPNYKLIINLLNKK